MSDFRLAGIAWIESSGKSSGFATDEKMLIFSSKKMAQKIEYGAFT